MTTYRERRYWADKFDPVIHALVRPYLGDLIEIVNADDIDDLERATDAIANGRIPLAKRVRDTDLRDITIRSWLNTGHATEADKLYDSLVQRYFYGWAAHDGSVAFDDWILFDVPRFVDAGFLNVWPEIPNKDGKEKFKAGPARDLGRADVCRRIIALVAARLVSEVVPVTTVSSSVRVVDAVDRAMSAWWPRTGRAPVPPLPECAVCGATSAVEALIVSDEGAYCGAHRRGGIT